MSAIRTRFCPSPTGYLHIGGLRNALYCYIFAKKQGGEFYLRIEDTDTKRAVADSYASILAGLKWAGMTYTEGPDIGGPYAPYIQTERSARHREIAHELVEKGHAYYCFCTKEELEEMRKMQESRGLPPQYDRRYRDFPKDQAKEWIAEGKSYVIRLKMPLDGDFLCEDIIRGKVRFPAKDLDDSVLLKNDGIATYHLAAMVDDHDMHTSHIFRSEEWLPSMPKHVHLFRCMGWDVPQFAHLPLILNEDRTKMSKRKGDVSLDSYIQKGYLKEGLLNFVAFLGWTHPEQKEVLSLDELINTFDINKAHKAGAVFKKEKLDWLNAQHIRTKSPEELMTLILEHGSAFGHLQNFEHHVEMTAYNGGKIDHDTFLKMVKHTQQKLILLADFPEQISWYFPDTLSVDIALYMSEKMKVTQESALLALQHARAALEAIPAHAFMYEHIKETLLALAVTHGLSNGQLLWPLRVALSGLPASPGAFELLDILGKERSLQRIDAGILQLR